MGKTRRILVEVAEIVRRSDDFVGLLAGSETPGRYNLKSPACSCVSIRQNPRPVKCWEIIADNLSRGGFMRMKSLQRL